LAAASAIVGFGLFALPAGIIASGFQEEMQRMKSSRGHAPHEDGPPSPERSSEETPTNTPQRCPRCGERLDEM